jgi:Fungal protein kinase
MSIFPICAPNYTSHQGTIQFLSLRLLDAWEFENPYVHTAIDDLESFLWVLLSSILSILELRNALDKHEAAYLRHIRARDATTLSFKPATLGQIQTSIRLGEASTTMQAFGPLLADWGQIFPPAAEAAALALKLSANPMDELAKLTADTFKQYFTTGVSQLMNLPRSWDVLIQCMLKCCVI